MEKERTMADLFANKFGKRLRGVNLGGWLVLEKWMTPSLFENLRATDETSFCVELGRKAEDRLRGHWDTFITEDDFEWLSQRGINAVRIPIGYWIFGSPYPYHNTFGGNKNPFVDGGAAILDSAFAWAEKHGLLIVLDLHAAPGCQNGFDNGGILGVVDWPTKREYIDFSLDILGKLAAKYGKHKCLHAIEVINEPRWDIPTPVLKEYTSNAYSRIRTYCGKLDVAVVFHDGFRSYSEWTGFMREPTHSNVILDIHRYQCFAQEDRDMDIYGHIQKAAIHWKNEADEIIAKSGLWTYVGEWSLGLDVKVVSLWEKGVFNHALERMDLFQEHVSYRAYGAAQLITFEKYLGWFFWSYKTETTPAWCFRDCVNRGWLPDNFNYGPPG